MSNLMRVESSFVPKDSSVPVLPQVNVLNRSADRSNIQQMSSSEKHYASRNTTYSSHNVTLNPSGGATAPGARAEEAGSLSDLYEIEKINERVA